MKDLDTTPTHATKYSAGADVIATEDITIGCSKLGFIKTGAFVPELMPKDYLLVLVPRSSICLKQGLIQPNSVGIIDADYKGEILGAFLNLGMKPVTIKAGERIGQLICIKYLTVYPRLNEERVGGFGSTNKPEGR